MAQGEKEFVSHSSALISIPLDTSLLNVPFSQFSSSLILLKSLRLLPRSVAVEIIRVPLLAGVGCLAEWPTRPKTQALELASTTGSWRKYVPQEAATIVHKEEQDLANGDRAPPTTPLLSARKKGSFSQLA